MVYVYSVYSKYDYKITKYKYFVRIIQFNFDTYNYEVIFEFPNNDLLSKFENHYEIISEKEYLDEIDFIKTNDLMGLSKIYMYAPNDIKFYDIWDEIKYFFFFSEKHFYHFKNKFFKSSFMHYFKILVP